MEFQIEGIWAEYASLRAPILTLPEELVVEIFQVLIEDSPIAISTPTSHPIFDLGLVCKTWRDFTLRMVTSWAKFSVRLDTLSSSPVPLLEQVLSRSQSLPLEFGVDILKRELRAVRKEDASEVLSTLLSHSSRWKGVDIRFVPSMVDSLLNPDWTCDFPKLEYLSLLPFPGTNGSDSSPLPIFENPLERLHSLHTIHAFIPSEPRQWMSVLQILELRGLRNHVQAHRVLKLCPHIVLAILSFHFLDYIFDDDDDLDAEDMDMDLDIIELPELQRLVMSWTGFQFIDPGPALTRLSNSIIAPSLNSLEIHSLHVPPLEVLESLNAVVIRSECKLTTLRLDTKAIDENIVSLFQGLHSLTHLHISFPLNLRSCEALKLKTNYASFSSSEALLPSLRHLDVVFGLILAQDLDDRDPFLHQNLELLHTRRSPPPNSGGRPLESVKIRFVAALPDHPAFNELLQPLREKGLRVDRERIAGRHRDSGPGDW